MLQGVTRYKLIPTFISEACVHSNATLKAIFNEVTCAILCKIASLTAFVSSSPFISFLTFSVFLFLNVRIPLDFASLNKNTEKHLLQEDGCMAVTLRPYFPDFHGLMYFLGYEAPLTLELRYQQIFTPGKC